MSDIRSSKSRSPSPTHRNEGSAAGGEQADQTNRSRPESGTGLRSRGAPGAAASASLGLRSGLSSDMRRNHQSQVAGDTPQHNMLIERYIDDDSISNKPEGAVSENQTEHKSQFDVERYDDYPDHIAPGVSAAAPESTAAGSSASATAGEPSKGKAGRLILASMFRRSQQAPVASASTNATSGGSSPFAARPARPSVAAPAGPAIYHTPIIDRTQRENIQRTGHLIRADIAQRQQELNIFNGMLSRNSNNRLARQRVTELRQQIATLRMEANTLGADLHALNSAAPGADLATRGESVRAVLSEALGKKLDKHLEDGWIPHGKGEHIRNQIEKRIEKNIELSAGADNSASSKTKQKWAEKRTELMYPAFELIMEKLPDATVTIGKTSLLMAEADKEFPLPAGFPQSEDDITPEKIAEYANEMLAFAGFPDRLEPEAPEPESDTEAAKP
jgi:hypothetical protein